MSQAAVVRPLQPDDGPACDAIVATLPYFFGDPAGVGACAEAVRTQEGWVAEEADGVMGFVTLVWPAPQSAEITWLAVRTDRRRQGIGRLLVEQAAEEAVRRRARFIWVLTLGPSVPEPGVSDGYAGTRAFYEKLGFALMGELRLSEWDSPAALLVRPLL